MAAPPGRTLLPMAHQRSYWKTGRADCGFPGRVASWDVLAGGGVADGGDRGGELGTA